MISRGQGAASNRLESLRQRHAELSRTIDQETKLPATDTLDLRRLKLEKLKIKEEIETMQQAS